MSRLNVFIDGSWLFKQCAPENTLAAHTEWPDKAFGLDFTKLNKVLLAHSAQSKPGCDALGERYLVTSIFTLPDNFDEWPAEYEGVTVEDVGRTRNGARAREHFVAAAVASGYSEDAVYRPRLKGWILKRLREGTCEEKQVDPTVVALLVRSAITQPEDYHVVITGDADMLPAIKVAYPGSPKTSSSPRPTLTNSGPSTGRPPSPTRTSISRFRRCTYKTTLST
jgi:hypothetical protein